jgi:hypothetical protein
MTVAWFRGVNLMSQTPNSSTAGVIDTPCGFCFIEIFHYNSSSSYSSCYSTTSFTKEMIVMKQPPRPRRKESVNNNDNVMCESCKCHNSSINSKQHQRRQGRCQQPWQPRNTSLSLIMFRVFVIFSLLAPPVMPAFAANSYSKTLLLLL